MPYLSSQDDHTIIALYIQPKSSKNKFRGLHGTEMKLAITAPPVDGKANKAVILFLAKLLGVPKSAVSLKRGVQSRHKQLAVVMDEEEVRMKIEGAVS